MSDPQADLEAVFARVLESARGSEMAVRLGQSLEVTDGLWELVPIVVAAAEAHERRPPAQVADSSAAAKGLTAERRASLRNLGETFRSAMAAASVGQPVDESALEGLTAAEIAADPFGVADTLMDTPGYIAAVLSSLGTGFFTELGAMSADEAAYLGT
jgi:hypothetical protein